MTCNILQWLIAEYSMFPLVMYYILHSRKGLPSVHSKSNQLYFRHEFYFLYISHYIFKILHYMKHNDKSPGTIQIIPKTKCPLSLVCLLVNNKMTCNILQWLIAEYSMFPLVMYYILYSRKGLPSVHFTEI
jgi:hypothetical protein